MTKPRIAAHRSWRGEQALHRLEAMARRSQDGIVQLSWHSAAGAVLLSQGKYEQAIGQLTEDSTNPLSLRLLEMAYRKSRATTDARQVAQDLSNLNLPTIEAAVVVPEFRAALAPHARFIPPVKPQFVRSRHKLFTFNVTVPQ